jgi:NitT/TauT family transport system substrate-binding protein
MGVLDVRFGRTQLVLACALMLVLAAGAASAQTAVKVTLDWRIEGPAAPFFVAHDKGYYRTEGLDVTIDTGASSLEPINRVASGSHHIGFGDINALIKFRDQNASVPVKAVFMVYNRPAYAIVARKSRGIGAPKDLEGKKLGAPMIDSAAAQWPLFARVNGIDTAKVTVENVGIPVREPMLAAGQVDAITGFSFSAYINLKDRGVPINDIVVLLMAEHGLELYGNAIIVNPKFAAEKPEAVKAFLRAFLKGLKDTLRNPSASIESVLNRNELARKDVELERLRMAIRDNIRTPEVRENGFGGIDSTRLERAIEQIGLTFKFRNKPAPTDIFDSSFLPPPHERRAN